MNHSALHKSIALVVDDHPETLRLLIDALESAEITVLVATDGRRALAQIETLMPDLILLDAMMPGMDGFETCRKLKSSGACDVPVIFMTGLDDTEHIVRGLEAGGVDYLTKPIAPDELLARIRVHLTQARATLASRAALDATGSTMLAAGADGSLRWATPQAQRLLAQCCARPAADSSGTDERNSDGVVPALPPVVQRWITLLALNPGAACSETPVVTAGETQIRFRYLSRVSDDEILLVLQPAASSTLERASIQKLQAHFRLTWREAEVLYWLSCGKANRDIAEILGMSPRTVNKHLEHVYTKAGVETRVAAAASALATLGTGAVPTMHAS